MTLVSGLRAGLSRLGTAARPIDGAALVRAPVQDRPPEVTIKRKSAQFPCFDGLRAVAALSVLTIHTAFDSGFSTGNHTFGGYTARIEFGPEVFFVVSGFLLYRPFVSAAMNRRAAPDRWKFWVRRLKRIIPGFWVAFLVATYVLRADSGGPHWYSPLVYMGFGQIYFPSLSLGGLSQAWTLDVEMAFYLVLPLYAALVGSAWLLGHQRGQGREPGHQLRVELFGLAALTAISFAWRVSLLLASEQSHAKGAILAATDWLPAYLDQFALGMLLAVVSTYLEATGRTPRVLWSRALPRVCWGIALVAFIAVSHIGLSRLPLVRGSVPELLGRQTLYGVIAVFLVAPAVFGLQDQGLIRAFLRWRPIVAIGIVSYGFYLWHQAWAAMFFRWTGAHVFGVHWALLLSFVTALAIVSGTASYWIAERPFIRYRFSSTRGTTGVTGAAGTIAAAEAQAQGAVA